MQHIFRESRLESKSVSPLASMLDPSPLVVGLPSASSRLSRCDAPFMHSHEILIALSNLTRVVSDSMPRSILLLARFHVDIHVTCTCVDCFSENKGSVIVI